MQMFVPQNGVGILRYERTRSTPIDPKLMFWCVSQVWLHLGLFHYCMELGAKRAELVQLMQKFMPRSGIGIFRDERTRSTPMDPKLLFLCGS